MTDDTHARFLIKISEDGIKKAALIKDFIEAYINGEPNIEAWIQTGISAKNGARWMAQRRKEQKKAALMNTDLNLDQKDVSEIFDILAEEEKENE